MEEIIIMFFMNVAINNGMNYSTGIQAKCKAQFIKNGNVFNFSWQHLFYTMHSAMACQMIQTMTDA